MTLTVSDQRAHVTGGVDTHKDMHMAAALDELGRLLGTRGFVTTPQGYAQLLSWLESFGPVAKVGVEGTGSWGAGLSRHLRAVGVYVVEVSCPSRQHRRRKGKSDPADADAAARAVLSGQATGAPRAGQGPTEAMRVLRCGLRSALRARTQAGNQIHSVLDTAPDAVRQPCRELSLAARVKHFAACRPGADLTDQVMVTKTVLRQLARRWLELSSEIELLRVQMDAVVRQSAPAGLLETFGVGIDTAAALLIAYGTNPDRCVTEAGFAALCGVSPLDASSGRQRRHRLNKGGDRQANSALWTIVMTRLRHDSRTQAYMERRLAEGKTKREVIRCLKRFVAREIWRLLARSSGQPSSVESVA